MAELGRAALVLTLGLIVYALVGGVSAACLGRRRLALSAQNALVAAFGSTLVAAGVLLAALLRNDFSFTYVAQTTSEALPTPYTISAFWGGQEGSLLLWLLVLTGFGAAAVRLNRGWARDLVVWVVPTRRWTLLAWAALGIGQLLGAHWAYEEVGWGGYYAWDPVENAALMPWLAATAFLHSVMIQEKRGMLKVWNVLLVILAFCLALFGTFLTRSGILNSIHSFTFSSIGSWFLGFIVFVTVASLTLVFI